MLIRVNGEAKNVSEGVSLAALLSELGLHGKLVAIEHNKLVIPRDRHAATNVSEGDEVEIVHFVGGG